MRIFVGLPLPVELASLLAERAGGLLLRNARLTPPENLHITLVFLGAVDENRLPAVLDQLSRIQSVPVEIRVGGLARFAHAGVLFSEVEPTPELLALQTQVAQCMAACGFTPDLRAFHPHITLARSRRRMRGDLATSGTPRRAIFEPQRFVANTVNLYRSVAIPGGVRYDVLGSRSL
jgi:2'-5' RNA ligase